MRRYDLIWVFAILSHLLGDFLTTYYFYTFTAISEMNLIVNTIIQQFGFIGFFMAKCLAIIILYKINEFNIKIDLKYGTKLKYMTPFIFGITGLFATLWNLIII